MMQGHKTREDSARRTREASRRQGDRSLEDGDIQEALRHYKKAVAENGDDMDSRMALADCYVLSEDAPKAVEQYRKALRVKPKQAGPHVGLGEVYKRYGQFRAAVVRFRKALEFEPENGFIWFKLADALLLSNCVEEAAEAGLEATRVCPDVPFYRYWAGDLLVRLERYAEAVEQLSVAVELEPEGAALHARLGVALAGAGQYVKAGASFARAVKFQPDKVEYLTLLGDLYRVNGEPGLAEQAYREAGEPDAYAVEEVRRAREEMRLPLPVP